MAALCNYNYEHFVIVKESRTRFTMSLKCSAVLHNDRKKCYESLQNGKHHITNLCAPPIVPCFVQRTPRYYKHFDISTEPEFRRVTWQNITNRKLARTAIITRSAQFQFEREKRGVNKCHLDTIKRRDS